MTCLALLAWVLGITHTRPGGSLWPIALAGVATGAASAVARPWRHLPTRTVLLAGLPFTAALAVCATSVTGFTGLLQAGRLGWLGLLYLLVRSLTGGPGRRAAVLVLLVGLTDQVLRGWVDFASSTVPAFQMVGTIGWWNQFAIFVLCLSLLAGTAAVRLAGRAALAAGVLAAVGLASVPLSGSRAVLALSVGCVVALAVGLGRLGGWTASLRRLGAIVVAAVGMATVVVRLGRPGGGGGALSVVADRAASQPLDGNTDYRLQLWRAGWHAFAQHPVAGNGFDTFRGLSAARGPASSYSAHSLLVQMLSDGGLLLAVPVLMGLLAGLWQATALTVCVWRRRPTEDLALRWVCGLAGAAAAVHALVDTDIEWSSVAPLLVVLPALASVPGRPVRRARVGAAVGVALLVLVPLSLLRAAAVRADGPSAGPVTILLGRPVAALPDLRQDQRLLARFIQGEAVPTGRVRVALDQVDRSGASPAVVRAVQSRLDLLEHTS